MHGLVRRNAAFFAVLLFVPGAIPAAGLAQDTAVAVLVETRGQGRLAPPWRIHRDSGAPDWSVEDAGATLTLRCDGPAAFGHERPLYLDPAVVPLLLWEWRVDRAPLADETAVAVTVFFDKRGFGRRAIRYVWAGAAEGLDLAEDVEPAEVSHRDLARARAQKRAQPGVQVRTMVVRSGADSLAVWLPTARDLSADHVRLFEEEPRQILGIRLHTRCEPASPTQAASFRAIRFDPRAGGAP